MSALPKTFMSVAGLIFSALLCALSFVTNPFSSTDGNLPEIPDDFQPVVQFVVASDSHNFNDRLKEMLATADEIVVGSNYEKIDAALIAGDFTDRGYQEELENFYNAFMSGLSDGTEPLVCLGNHELYTDNVHERFTELTGWDTNRHIVINGIHFIAVSYDTSGNRTFGLSVQSWLRKELKKAEADAPGKPIIVIQHPHPFSTVYGSVNWAEFQLSAVYNEFPQVINFSGHSHYPINDPRSIWQGGFTALGCGSLKYYEMELELTAGHCPEESNAGTFWLVGIDENGSVSLRAYDVCSGGFYDKAQYYIEKPGEKTSFKYTYKNVSKADGKPSFGNTEVTTTVNDAGETVITFPRANDNFVVHDYKLKLSSGISVPYKTTILADYYLVNEPDTYSVNVGVLESGKEYTFTATAANAYYKLSEPLSYTFTA